MSGRGGSARRRAPAALCTALVTLLMAADALPAADPAEHGDPRHRSDSLQLAGDFAALAGEDEPLTVTRQALAALPGYREIDAQLLPQEPTVTLGVLPLEALLSAYPLADGADGLVLETINRWESFVTVEHLTAADSLLLLYYDGEAPSAGRWPAWGGDVEPLAPFYAFDPASPMPSFRTSPAYGMIAATQIIAIRATSVAARYGAMLDAELSEPAQAGRALFLQRCNTCHQGPGGAGGNSSARPFALLTALATNSPDYFRRLVTNAKAFYPDTSMPAHGDFGDGEFEALLAFFGEMTP